MHQSGHSRAHSMQEVQFSSSRAITPRVRGGRCGGASGYSAVWLGQASVFAVVAGPSAAREARPGTGRRGMGALMPRPPPRPR